MNRTHHKKDGPNGPPNGSSNGWTTAGFLAELAVPSDDGRGMPPGGGGGTAGGNSATAVNDAAAHPGLAAADDLWFGDLPAGDQPWVAGLELSGPARAAGTRDETPGGDDGGGSRRGPRLAPLRQHTKADEPQSGGGGGDGGGGDGPDAAVSLDVPAFAAEALDAGQADLDGALMRACEPVFQLVCRLNRMKRLGTDSERFEPHAIRAEVERTFDRLAAAPKPGALAPALEAVAGPLRCFVDVVMTRAGFEFADRWRNVAPRWANPDRVLIGAAADALRDGRPSAAQRLEVLHACLCLTGDLLRPVRGLPSVEHLLDLAGRRLHRPAGERLCPAAYDGVFASAILPPLGRRLKALVVFGVGLLLLVLAGAVALNVRYTAGLDESIDTVRRALDHPTDGADAGATGTGTVAPADAAARPGGGGRATGR